MAEHGLAQPARGEEALVSYARELVLGSLGIALGVTLPMAFHAAGAGMAGRALLPMFLPLLLVGLLTRWWIAALAGLVTPLLSFGLTGMPPPPALFTMPVELAVLAGVASLLRRGLGLNEWLAALGAVLAGRLTLGLVVMVAGSWLGITAGWWLYVVASVVAGLPGIALLLAVAPALARAAGRNRLVG